MRKTTGLFKLSITVFLIVLLQSCTYSGSVRRLLSSLQNPGPDIAVPDVIVKVMGQWSDNVHEGVMLIDDIFASMLVVAKAK